MILPLEVLMSLIDVKGRCNPLCVFVGFIGEEGDRMGIANTDLCKKVCPFFKDVATTDYEYSCTRVSAYDSAIKYLTDNYPVEAYKFFLREV